MVQQNCGGWNWLKTCRVSTVLQQIELYLPPLLSTLSFEAIFGVRMVFVVQMFDVETVISWLSIYEIRYFSHSPTKTLSDCERYPKFHNWTTLWGVKRVLGRYRERRILLFCRLSTEDDEKDVIVCIKLRHCLQLFVYKVLIKSKGSFTSISCVWSSFSAVACFKACSSSLLRSSNVFPNSAASCRSVKVKQKIIKHRK